MKIQWFISESGGRDMPAGQPVSDHPLILVTELVGVG